MNDQMSNRIQEGSMFEKISLATELYYIYNFSQQEISKRMGVSRPWVSKLLKRAEELGIVRIEVLTPSAGSAKLEAQLVEKYHIKGAKIIKKSSEDSVMQNAGKAAANYLLSIIKEDDVIGVSWGSSLAALADQFTPVYYPNVSVIPIIGGMGVNPELLSNQIASRVAAAMDAKSYLLHAPAFTIGKAERDIFLKDPSIKEIINKCDFVDIVITGLGSLRGSTMQLAGYISNEEIEELENLGAIGDIALRFINRDGEVISHQIHDRLVASELGKLRERARVIVGIATGKNKVDVIRAALKGKWLDALITDYETAEALLA